MSRPSLPNLALRTVAAGAFLLAAACGGDDYADAAAEDSAAGDAMLAVAAPDTTATGVWTHLETQRYAATWPMWPGKSALYSGAEPHGMLLTTYVNGLALDAITNGATVLPAGSIVVKENYMPDSTLAAVTVMYKSAGYDGEHNDWFWMKRLADGTVEASGRVGMCQTCHGQSSTDFIMTAALGGSGM